MKKLTYEDLAVFYKEKTGSTAKTKPLEFVYEWASKQEEIQINEDDSLSFKAEKVKVVKEPIIKTTEEEEALELKHQEWISPSSINAYMKCPRCYFYQYIAKIPQPPSIHLVKGIIVHETLEYFFKAYRKGMKEHYYDLYNKAVKRHQKELDNLEFSKEEMNSHITDMNNIINEYYLSFERQIKNMIDTGKVHGESHAFHMVKPKFRELFVKNEDLHVRGYIDRVNTDFNGIVTVADYKTSKKFGIGFPMDYKRQLSIYALLYNEQEKEVPDFAAVNFLRYGETYFLEITPNIMKFARDTIIDVYNKTRSLDIEDYPVSVEAKYCNYSALHDGSDEWKKQVRMEKLKKSLKKKAEEEVKAKEKIE